MTRFRGFWVWMVLGCWLAGGSPAAAWAKGKADRKQAAQAVAQPEENSERPAVKKPVKKAKKGKKAEPEPPAAPTAAAPPPPGIEDPQTLLLRARELENRGDVAGCLETLAKFVNVHFRHPERAAVLQRMAFLAQDRGQGDKALQIHALTVFLYPGSRAAAECRWQIENLEFCRNLRERDPLAVFKDYLEGAKSQSPGVAPAKLREPLRQGWQAVEQVLRRTCPCPLPLVEEALALWELHPEGTQPPEAALILGELLLKNGLLGEARNFLLKAREQGNPAVRTRAMVGLLETAWESRDLGEFAGAWTLWRRNRGEATPDLKARLHKLPLPEALFSKTPEAGPEDKKVEDDALAALLDWWSGRAPDASRQAELLHFLPHFLNRPLPPGVKKRLLLQMAQLQWSQGHYPQAAQVYEQLLRADAQDENSAFYHDRLALSQLQGRRPEEAQQIFRDLSHEGDNFWQLVSRTRLADMELGRLQAEPPQ